MRRFTVLALAAILLATVVSADAASAARRCRTAWGSVPETSADATEATLTNVRVGRHRCFDRLVIDLQDGPAAGYRVEYVSSLRQDGSGNVVQVDGGAILRIIATAPSYDADGNATLRARRVNRLDVDGFKTFRDVRWAGSFEGQTTIGLGVRARLPFRVFTIDGTGDGARLVIDVAHSWR